MELEGKRIEDRKRKERQEKERIEVIRETEAEQEKTKAYQENSESRKIVQLKREKPGKGNDREKRLSKTKRKLKT